MNFSQYTAGGASPGTNVRTTFTKLRIDPATLTVDIGDLTYAHSTGALTQGATNVTSMPYAVAMSCIAPQNASGVGNINLKGTGFKVDDTQAFVSGGFQATGSAVISANRETADLTGGGFCGWETPAPALFNPFNPSKGEYHLQLKCAWNPLFYTNRQFCVHLG